MSSIRQAGEELDDVRSWRGDDHPDTQAAIARLARAHRDAGDLHTARSMLDGLLATQRRLLGEDHIDTLKTEFDLGLVVGRLGDHFSAWGIQERILKAADEGYGPDSELSTRSAINLANTLRKLERFDAELVLRERVVDARRRSVGTHDLAFFRSLGDLAVVNQNLEHFNLALDLSQVVLEGFVEHQVDRRTIIEVQLNMVNDLVRLKRAGEAADLFESVYEEINRTLPSDDPIRKQAARHELPMRLLGKAVTRRDTQRLRRQGRKG